MPPAKKPTRSSPRTARRPRSPPRSSGSTDRSMPPRRRWWSCVRTPGAMSARAPAICTRTYARSSRARDATAASSRRRCSATSSRRRSDSRASLRQGLALPRRRAVRESLKPGPGAAPPRPAEQSPASGNATAMSRARHSRRGTKPRHCGTSGPCVGETPQFVPTRHSGIRRSHFSGAGNCSAPRQSDAHPSAQVRHAGPAANPKNCPSATTIRTRSPARVALLKECRTRTGSRLRRSRSPTECTRRDGSSRKRPDAGAHHAAAIQAPHPPVSRRSRLTATPPDPNRATVVPPRRSILNRHLVSSQPAPASERFDATATAKGEAAGFVTGAVG